MNEHAAQLVESNAGKPWDLGSNPRSPHILVIFLCNTFRYSTSPDVHHTFTIQACHTATKIKSKARMRGPSYTSIDHATRALKSQPGQASMGQIPADHTSKWAYKPPMFAFFSLFLLFFSISYFNSFLYFI